MTDPQPSRTRWKIALGVVVLSAVFGWLAWPAYQRHRAIQEIESVGGRLLRESGSFEFAVRPRALNGDDPIVGVSFSRSGELYDSNVLKFISSIPTVEKIILNDVPTNGEGLEHLKESRVTNLQLVNSSVDDFGVLRIVGLANLEQLWLDRTQVTDDGLRPLHRLTNLGALSLEGTRIGDEGLKIISGLSRLEALRLDNTVVSDDGLSHLVALSNLRLLYLGGTGITDDGLKHLSNLSNLEMLSIPDTNVSENGVKMLQESLPNCDISR